MSNILDLEPKKIWFFFHQICQIPHSSGKEEKIRNYLLDFGKQHHLETSSDEVGNVLLRKKASAGYESAPAVILQGHMDMVSEKNNDTVHNFDVDPIETYIDGDWVRAKGTTLGADDGIGVAAILAVLDSDELKHPALDCIITVDEERGLTGAQHVSKDWLTAPRLLNLDSEDDGRFCIGCAGGVDTVATYIVEREDIDDSFQLFRIEVKGLLGGHSGDDINKGRGNAIKILSRFLWNQNKLFPVRLQSIKGGNLHNAIPREACASVFVPLNKKEELRKNLNLYIATIEEEYPFDKDFQMSLESQSNAGRPFTKRLSDSLLYALFACPHGVIGMSREMAGLPETSTNLASVKMPTDDEVIISTSQRSAVESKKEEIKDRVEAVFALSGAATVTHSDGYPGWNPNVESAVKNIVVEAFRKVLHEEPVICAIHAGLECGLFLAKNPKLDMISFGPDIFDNHSPMEKCRISSVERFWRHLVQTLEDLKN